MTTLLVTESKYRFVPPHEGRIWPRMLGRFTPGFLKWKYGITDIEIRGEEKLSRLLKAGQGILLAPNHCRMSDALVLQSLSNRTRQPFFVMASSHLFRGSRFLSWVLRRLGGFSVYREGIDRQAIQKGIDILVGGQRPLVLFPEGALSQSNDHLNTLQEGVSFIARAAASKLERAGAQTDEAGRHRVYAVPVAIRYLYRGDIETTAGALLSRIEQRLSWRPVENQGLVERIYRVGNALLSLKEQEFLGHIQEGELDDRLNRLVDHLLGPLETEWLGGVRPGSVIARVKDLRRAILPDLIEKDLSSAERDRRWRQLTDAGLAQSLSLYPAR